MGSAAVGRVGGHPTGFAQPFCGARAPASERPSPEFAPSGASFARLLGMASKQAASAKPSGARGARSSRSFAAGEMTFEEYLDYRAARAVDYLRSTVSEEQLELVPRETVRAQLESDPNLAALIRRVTGSLNPRDLGRS